MSRVPLFPLLWLSTATKNCLKDAVWTVLYQNQPFLGHCKVQNTVLKMSLVIFAPERSTMNIYGYSLKGTSSADKYLSVNNAHASALL